LNDTERYYTCISLCSQTAEEKHKQAHTANNKQTVDKERIYSWRKPVTEHIVNYQSIRH